MTFFHVNYSSGNPEFCEIALGGTCPLGFTSEEHLEREEEARAVFEEFMEAFTLTKPLKRSDLK